MTPCSWAQRPVQTAADFRKHFLLHHWASGNDINGNPKPFTASGLATVYAGDRSAAFFKVQPGDPRVPDIFGIAQYGTVFTGGTGKSPSTAAPILRIATFRWSFRALRFRSTPR